MNLFLALMNGISLLVWVILVMLLTGSARKRYLQMTLISAFAVGLVGLLLFSDEERTLANLSLLYLRGFLPVIVFVSGWICYLRANK